MRTTPMIVVIKTIIKTTAIITLSAYAISGFSETPSHTNSNIPTKGMTQTQVKSTFGEPGQIKPPVGKPAITRWDYSHYSVYFEGKYVIHSFRHSQRIPRISATPSTQPPEAPLTKHLSSNKEPKEAMPVEKAMETSADKTEKVEEAATTPTKKAVVEEMVNEDIAKETNANTEEIDKAGKQVKEEKDLNFEEPDTKTDFGKWGY